MGVEKNDIVLRPSYWACVSGGKDSLFMLMLILSHPDKYPLDGVVHYELEIDYPFIKDVVDLMQEKVEALGIPFVRIRPNISWFDLVEKYGMPTRLERWCNSQYKLDCHRQLKNFLKTKGENLISYIGFCADEVNRFKNDGNIYPLANEGVLEETILHWASQEIIFNNYYKFNKRCGCMYCPLASLNELAYLYVFYPEDYQIMIFLCKEKEQMLSRKYGKPFSMWQSNPKYNTDYYDMMVKNKYAPIILDKLERGSNVS